MRLRLAVALTGWYDGDTFYGVLDHGLGIYRGQRLAVVAGRAVVEPIRHRCWGIDAPELKTGEPGRTARTMAEAFAPAGMYECWSYKPDDFGRPLLDLILSDGRLFSEAMTTGGWAARREA